MNDDERDRLVAELLERPQERELILRDAELNDREPQNSTASLRRRTHSGSPPKARQHLKMTPWQQCWVYSLTANVVSTPPHCLV